MWKTKITQILGNIWAPCLIGAMFGTTTVLFIILPISHNNPKTIIELINNKD